MSVRDQIQADIDVLADGLISADQAGDTERAQKLAAAYKKAKRRLRLIESDPGEYDPGSKEFQEKYGPASGMTGFGRFVTGADKLASDRFLGFRQVASGLADLLPVSPASAGSVAGKDALRDEVARRKTDDAPLNKGAGLAGQIAMDVSLLAPLGGLAGSVPKALALGAAEGFTMPAETEGERALNTGIGAVGGAGGEYGSRLAQRAFTPFRRGLTGGGDEAVELLSREGIDLDVAQKTGSGSAQRLRSSFGDNPLTTGSQQNFTEKQRRQFTKSVLRRIGVNSEEATPGLLRRAVKDIGDSIDQALRTKPPVWDDALDAQIKELQEIIPGSLSDVDARPLLRNISDLMDSAIDSGDMTISPEVFTRVRGNLANLRAKGNVLASDVEDIMLDALSRAGGDPAWLKTTLARYRNWKIIENAIDRGSIKTISPKKLANTFFQKRNRATSLRHLGHPETVELSKLADAAYSVLPETIGNSGTFGRAMVGEGLLAAGGFGGALATGQDVGDAAAIGLGAAALPIMLQKGMLSQGAVGNYLTSGFSPTMQAITGSPVTQSLIRQGVISSGLLSN